MKIRSINGGYGFKFGTYKELFESQYNGISLEALLYDAYQGINLSIHEIFGFYLCWESRLSSDVKRPLKEFIYNRLSLLINMEIEPNDLLSPLGGQNQKKFYHSKDGKNRQQILSLIQDLKRWEGLSNKKAFEKYHKVNEHSPSIKTLEADNLILETRRKRLKKVEMLLATFYFSIKNKDEPSSPKKYLDPAHKSESLRESFNKLQEIYKSPLSLT